MPRYTPNATPLGRIIAICAHLYKHIYKCICVCAQVSRYAPNATSFGRIIAKADSDWTAGHWSAKAGVVDFDGACSAYGTAQHPLDAW